MDAKYWSEPNKFKLDRWNEKHIQGTYFPFSMGARDCIGKDLAMKEAKMAIATLLKNFDFVFDPKWKLKKTTQLSVIPVNGVPVTARRREVIA
jgi:cytochrome P450/NADPH-cytochrome P450 reductase